jgi:hypothetical protein
VRDIEFSGMSLTPGTVKTARGDEAVEGEGDVVFLEEEDVNEIDRLSNFEVQFSIVGEKDRLLDFVSDLNEISPLMKVDYFSTSIVSGGGDEREEEGAVVEADEETYLQATLKLIVYYKPGVEGMKSVSEVDEISLSLEEEKFLTDIEGYLFLDERFIKADDVIIDAPLGKSNPFIQPVGRVVQTSDLIGEDVVVLQPGGEGEGVAEEAQGEVSEEVQEGSEVLVEDEEEVIVPEG